MINRRDFMKAGIGGGVALAGLQARAFAAAASDEALRVALIGCGWYGKTDFST